MSELFIFAFWIFTAIICGMLARNRRRNIAMWVILGFVFSIFAVIIVALLPPRKPAETHQRVALSLEAMEKGTLSDDDAAVLRAYLNAHLPIN